MFSTDRRIITRSNTFAFFAIFLLVTAARLVYVSLYATDTPYWDQWDSEADLLLRPWTDGTWSLRDLFSPHNEHRIAFTRLLSLGVYILNDHQWNNLAEAYINSALAGTYLAVLFMLLARESTRAGRVAAMVLIVLAGVLPFSWENFLVGFQSQFYFMALMAIVMMGLAAFRNPGTATTCLLTLAGFASLFTAASGLVGALGVITIVAARCWRSQRVMSGDVVLFGLMLIVAATGLYITPSLPYHEPLKASGVVDNARALATALMWPVQPLGHRYLKPWWMFVAAVAMWAPSAAWLWRYFKTREASKSGYFALGMSSWAFVQCLALAHSRGHATLSLASRYMDLPAIAVIINGWLAADLLFTARLKRDLWRTPGVIAACFAFVTLGGFVARNHGDLALMQQRTYLTTKETLNVRGYMLSGDAGWLDQPFQEIPYPSATRLKSLLDNATIAAMLPPSIRRPLVGPIESPTDPAMLPTNLNSAPGPLLFYGASPAGGAMPKGIEQPLGPTRFPYVTLYGAGPMRSSQIEGLSLKGKGTEAFSSFRAAPDQWRRAYAPTHFESGLTLLATVPAGSWLAVTSPVEAGRLSIAALIAQDAVRKLAYHIWPSLRPADIRSRPHGSQPEIAARTRVPYGPHDQSGRCVVDLVDGKPPSQFAQESTDEHDISLIGWAVLETPRIHSNRGVVIEIVTNTGEVLDYEAASKPRPDVMSALGAEGLDDPGFEAHIRLHESSLRVQSIRVLQRERGGRVTACPLAPISAAT